MDERLDHRVLEELKGLMEDDFGLLLETYLRDSEHQLHEVADAWDDGDLERVRRSAHSLKGSSRNVGALALAVLCGELEELARLGRTDGVPLAVERVRAELREVRDAVVAVHNIH